MSDEARKYTEYRQKNAQETIDPFLTNATYRLRSSRFALIATNPARIENDWLAVAQCIVAPDGIAWGG